MNATSRFLKAIFVAAAALSMSNGIAQSNLPSLDLKPAWPNLKFSRPLGMAEAPDGTHRQFVVEQDGRVWILPKDWNSAEPILFLDISDRKPHRDNEEGLLSLAFHPQFKANGLFYLFYSQQNPKRDVISEVRVAKTDSNKADLATERVVLEVMEPYWNHNGGAMLFGPDGYLYLSFGDGGAADDPHLNGQNLHQLLGKIVRIDVNSRTDNLAYGIPKDNPFLVKDKSSGTNIADARPEIYAVGLRNVWRMSFDRQTGELWAADVGQNKFEEVDLIVKGGNYGWSVREGFHPFKEQKSQGALLDPVIEYGHNPQLAAQSKFPDHSIGISITGGYVYRGKKIPVLRGVYVYADFTMGTIWGLRYESGKLTADAEIVKGNQLRSISSFGEDSDGELYVISFDGKIYEFTDAGK
jgi:glucose/arabinose dehydrogenase